MKKLLTIVLLTMLVGAIMEASINLTSPTVVTVGGVTTETDAAAGVMVYNVNYFQGQGSLDVFFHQGTVSSQQINKGSIVPVVELSIDLNTGKWITSTGGSGTLTAPQLTAVQTQLRNNRNSLETFAVNNGIIAGTQVSW